jgi:hypothetical protein
MVRQDPRLSIAGPPSGPTHVLCPTAIDVFGRTRLGTIALADLVILCGDLVRAHEDFMGAWLTGLETSTQTPAAPTNAIAKRTRRPVLLM